MVEILGKTEPNVLSKTVEKTSNFLEAAMLPLESQD